MCLAVCQETWSTNAEPVLPMFPLKSRAGYCFVVVAGSAACLLVACAVRSHARHSSDPVELLARADDLSWKNQWIEAAPVYAEAERRFTQEHRLSEALYAHVSQFVPRAESEPLPQLLLELKGDLELPIAQPAETKLRILVIEGMREGLRCDGPITFTRADQVNASACFSLVRFEVQDGRAFWFKAVGAPNTHEFSITSYLVKHCPEYLPPVIGMRSSWNAWIMKEAGSSLYRSNDLLDFERAVHRLAGMQKTLLGQSSELLEAQCSDHRGEALAAQVDATFDYLVEVMALQKTTEVPRLSEARLKVIRGLVGEACVALRTAGIPDTVMHSDISPGSILSDGSNYVFTDWCEANVGNPFITFEQLCVHVLRKASRPDVWASRLRHAYKSSWNDVLTERQIEIGLGLTPLVSIFSYMYGRGDWLHSDRRYDTAFQSYARSLARHMDRAAEKSTFLEELCLPA
jgi:hypothetical protein